MTAMRSGAVSARHLQTQPTPPATAVQRELLRLWEDVLAAKDPGIDDDYFEVGGTSLLAVTLFAEISRRFGVKLPLTTILTSPTVRLLAANVTEAIPDEPSTLLRLKNGSERNLFLVHDGDGETLLYANLAKHLPDGLAVYGINPRSETNVPLADVSIVDMAKFYVENVLRVQPHGPYLLSGMCAGGVIAFEMASQLIARGQTVQLVALLDAATPQAERRKGRISSRRLQRLSALFASPSEMQSLPSHVRFVVTEALKKVRAVAVWEIKSRLQWLSVRARFKLLRYLKKRGYSWPEIIPSLSVRQIYENAEKDYFPCSIAADEVLVVRATCGEAGDTPYVEIYADPLLGWEGLAPRIEGIDVSGGHFTMLQEPAVEGLASVLTSVLTLRPAALHQDNKDEFV